MEFFVGVEKLLLLCPFAWLFSNVFSTVLGVKLLGSDLS